MRQPVPGAAMAVPQPSLNSPTACDHALARSKPHLTALHRRRAAGQAGATRAGQSPSNTNGAAGSKEPVALPE